jgi:hypothetical protein
MNRRELMQTMGMAAVLPLVSGVELHAQTSGDEGEAVFELRTYHTVEGKLEPLLKRFREKETSIFERLGMPGVAYWTPTDDPLKGRTLVYMLKHKNRAAAAENWKRFGNDPEWIKLRDETEANGPLVEKHESLFLALTDFSPHL